MFSFKYHLCSVSSLLSMTEACYSPCPQEAIETMRRNTALQCFKKSLLSLIPIVYSATTASVRTTTWAGSKPEHSQFTTDFLCSVHVSRMKAINGCCRYNSHYSSPESEQRITTTRLVWGTWISRKQNNLSHNRLTRLRDGERQRETERDRERQSSWIIVLNDLCLAEFPLL